MTMVGEDILAELRRAMRVRRAPDFDSLSLPGLEAATSRCQAEDLRGLLTEAVERVPDQQYRQAAEALFGFGPDRWTALRTRRTAAATFFGVGVDAFRRSGTGHESDVIAAVAAAIMRMPERTASTRRVTSASFRQCSRPGWTGRLQRSDRCPGHQQGSQ